MSQSRWTSLCELDAIEVGESRLFKCDGLQVAVFRTDESRYLAIDNICPHEGYPLLGGPVKDCVVTCPWHNYKFDLSDGHCVKGEEDVRAFPLRIIDGRVEVDLAEPEPAVVLAKLERSLDDGMWRGNLGQVARDLLRWLESGGSPASLALVCARFDASYAEWGTSHALPVAVDTLAIANARDGTDRVLPLLYAFEMASDEQRRRESRPTSAPLDGALPGHDQLRLRMLDLVEEERADEAEALLRAMIRKGTNAGILEALFQELCARHFLGFGHPLIYVSKAFDLLQQVGIEHAEELLPALLLRILRSTRESLLPEWSRWRGDMTGLAERWQSLWVGMGSRPATPCEALRQELLDGTSEQAFSKLLACIEAGAELSPILDALSLASAERLLRFDTDIEEDPGIQEGWLHVTHRFTFVNAIRNCAARRPGAWILPLLFQAAHWIQAARPLDMARPDWNEGSSEDGTLDGLMQAIRAPNQLESLARLRTYLEADDAGCRSALRSSLEELVLSGPVVRPIVSAHLIKTLTAAMQEADCLDHEEATLPIQAFIRLLTSPLVENVLPRRVHEAIGFVIHGRVPKTLT